MKLKVGKARGRSVLVSSGQWDGDVRIRDSRGPAKAKAESLFEEIYDPKKKACVIWDIASIIGASLSLVGAESVRYLLCRDH